MPPPNVPSVLVVDDQPDFLKLIQRVLGYGNFQVTCADSGRQAIDHLRDHRYEVVLTDIFMPEVDGTEVIAAARQSQPRAFVIAVSGGGSYMSSPEALQIAQKLGADDALPKPFTPGQLLERVIRGIACCGKHPGENWRQQS